MTPAATRTALVLATLLMPQLAHAHTSGAGLVPFVALAAGFAGGLLLAFVQRAWRWRVACVLLLLGLLPVLYVASKDHSILESLTSALEFFVVVVAFLFLPAAAAGALGYATSSWFKRARQYARRHLSNMNSTPR